MIRYSRFHQWLKYCRLLSICPQITCLFFLSALRFLSDTLRDGINEDYQGLPAFPSNVSMTRPTEKCWGSCDSLWHGVAHHDCPKFIVRIRTSGKLSLIPHHCVTWELRCHCLLDFVSGWCFENMTGKVTPDSSTSESPKAAARIHIHWFNETQWTRLGRWVKMGNDSKWLIAWSWLIMINHD